MKRVGLTGGIATGKSTVLQLWQRRLGASLAVIETDEVAHRALRPDASTYAAVVKEFGEGILNPDRTINRRELGRIVFATADRRAALNAIVHPWVRAEWSAQISRFEAQPGLELIVVCIPLLFEVSAENEFQCVVAVGSSETTQVARLTAKGYDEAEARARIRSQLPVQTKLDRAHFAIWNDGSLEVLARQTEMILDRIKETKYAPSKN